VVRMATVRMEPQVLVEHALARLRAHLEPSYSDVEMRVSSRLDVLRVPVGEIVLAAHVMAGATPQRRMRVDVELRTGPDFLRTVPIWFEVRAHAPGWVLSRDVPAGQVLRVEDVERRQIDVAHADGKVIAPATDLVGLRLRRAARAGTTLSAAMLDSVPVVSRQEDVTIEVRAGDVVIESRGTALSEGRAGDLVPVSVSGGDLLRARVVGPRRLKLNLEEKR
jgi:flagella basal body P-ring formation protein FlgA